MCIPAQSFNHASERANTAARYDASVSPLDHLFGLPLRVLRLWNDTRTWAVRGEKIPSNAGISLPATTSAPLMRLLLEAGIALSPATSFVDLAAWYPVFRYADAFAPPGGELRFVASAATWEYRLVQAIGEELGVAAALHVARQHLGVVHVADVVPLLKAGDLVLKHPPASIKYPQARPDFLCELSNGESILIESKGAVGPRRKLTRAIQKGEVQVDNVDFVRATPRQVGGVTSCDRLVMASHFCVAGTHSRSKTTTLVIDPPAPEPNPNGPPRSDLAVRVSYGKALNLAGQEILARDLVARRPVRFDDLPQIELGGRRLIGIGPFVLGGALVLDNGVAGAIAAAGGGDLRILLRAPLESIREAPELDEPDFILLNNGVGLVRTLRTRSPSPTATVAISEWRSPG